jgi:hypothetical protein
MQTLTINHKNGHQSIYNLLPVNNLDLPIAYKQGTPEVLINVLEVCRKAGTRIRFNFGDPETGKSWNEEHDTTGTIGLSRGHSARYPILLANSRSYAGGEIMTDRILQVKNTFTGIILYTHPNFKPSNIEIKPSQHSDYKFELFIDGQIYSRHRSEKAAKMLKSKLS